MAEYDPAGLFVRALAVSPFGLSNSSHHGLSPAAGSANQRGARPRGIDRHAAGETANRIRGALLGRTGRASILIIDRSKVRPPLWPTTRIPYGGVEADDRRSPSRFSVKARSRRADFRTRNSQVRSSTREVEGMVAPQAGAGGRPPLDCPSFRRTRLRAMRLRLHGHADRSRRPEGRRLVVRVRKRVLAAGRVGLVRPGPALSPITAAGFVASLRSRGDDGALSSTGRSRCTGTAGPRSPQPPGRPRATR